MAAVAQPTSGREGASAARQARGSKRESVELRVEVQPRSPFKLVLASGRDGVLRRRGAILERLVHAAEDPVHVRVAQGSPQAVTLWARASSPEAAKGGIQSMRFALGLDDDLAPFLKRFWRDPLIGRSLRARPWLRVRRRPEPFEALAWAICEQLIEFERAARIERRIVARIGRPCRWRSGLRDLPSAATLAGVAPALLQSFDLAGSRAIALIRVAREVCSGRVDLQNPPHEVGWRRLRAIPGVGPWTVEMLALRGQGRYDQLPAGDLGLLELVGRSLSAGDPHARASEVQVREFFAPYGEWAGLAAAHMLTA